MANTDSGVLSTEQSNALFDLLTHRATYKEIENFKIPGAIYNYGPPFQDDSGSSSSPILQVLLSKFVLKLPGLRDVSPDFWKVRVEDLIQALAEAELSESYDKGLLGIRKTLATAISALLEYPARGVLGGYPEETTDKSRKYDISNPEDVLQSWPDCLQGIIYGDLIDEIFSRTAETDDLSKHDSLVQGMHEFILVNLASLMHYTLVLSPEGPTLLRMLESVHRLIPYTIVRQTLKIGNVATMISAMMRVILAKVSMGSVTNWMGLSKGANEGMNLLQQIISQVLNWDKRELRNRAEKIEKSKQAPPKAVREELSSWMSRSREEHEQCRQTSRDQDMSIVAVILALSSDHSVDELTKEQHANALEWLSLQLGIRDRKEIIQVLCHHNPDHLTAAIQDAVAAYTPMVRSVHQAVSLTDAVWDFERFLTDMLKMSKPAKSSQKLPSVEDYVDLLHRHQSSFHKFLHQVAKNGKEVVEWWREYVHMAAAQFRADGTQPESKAVVSEKLLAGGVRDEMMRAFEKLSEEEKLTVRGEIDLHQKYLDDLHAASAARISAVIKRTGTTPFGPGAYLARWQDLLDNTLITPCTTKGPVRHGADESVKIEARKDVDGSQAGAASQQQTSQAIKERSPEAPQSAVTWSLLGHRFQEILGAQES